MPPWVKILIEVYLKGYILDVEGKNRVQFPLGQGFRMRIP